MGIPHHHLMHGAHWRKKWPEGNTDNGDGDEDVINIGGDRRRSWRKWMNPPTITYPFTIDADILDSQRHLDQYETHFKHKLT